MMRFDVITLFPGLFDALLDFGISGRALDRGLFRFKAWNPRDFATDNYRTVDDRPYGGGPGMVMLAEPLDAALDAIEAEVLQESIASHVIYFTPRGKPLVRVVLEVRQQGGDVVAADSGERPGRLPADR